MIKKTFLKKLGILEEIENYIKVIKKNKIQIKKIILFGSYAKNNQRQYSDIDLAIISNEFKNDVIGSMMKLLKLTNKVSDRIEVIAFTEEELKNKYHPLIGEIKKSGQIIYKN